MVSLRTSHLADSVKESADALSAALEACRPPNFGLDTDVLDSIVQTVVVPSTSLVSFVQTSVAPVVDSVTAVVQSSIAPLADSIGSVLQAGIGAAQNSISSVLSLSVQPATESIGALFETTVGRMFTPSGKGGFVFAAPPVGRSSYIDIGANLIFESHLWPDSNELVFLNPSRAVWRVGPKPDGDGPRFVACGRRYGLVHAIAKAPDNPLRRHGVPSAKNRRLRHRRLLAHSGRPAVEVQAIQLDQLERVVPVQCSREGVRSQR